MSASFHHMAGWLFLPLRNGPCQGLASVWSQLLAEYTTVHIQDSPTWSPCEASIPDTLQDPELLREALGWLGRGR